MKQYQDIAYAPEHGEHGFLDIALPDHATGCPIVMVIHGGALREFSKERMAGIVEWIVEQGWVAVSINYRLLPQCAYPEPLEDTLDAFRWMRAGEHEGLKRQDLSRVALLGASAGGFLALAAGFLLGSFQVGAIVSISGPTLPHWYRKDAAYPVQDATHPVQDSRLLRAPIELIGPDVPPVLAVHSRNDKLVPTQESIQLVDRLHGAGRSASLYLFDGPGELHGIWRNTEEPLYLFPHIERAIADFLRGRFAPMMQASEVE
jgi:acetyl esterase